MENKRTYTKMLYASKLLSCPLDEYEYEANKMIKNKYEPIGTLATVLKDGVIICTQLWGDFVYVDSEGYSSDFPWEDDNNDDY